MPDFYGVKTKEVETSVNTPVVATSGITIAFGTAPIHQVDGTANEIILANSYDEAVSALGYSDDWEHYTLCEVIYSHFKLYGVAPLLLVNVLDPDKHKQAVTGATMQIANGQIALPEEALPDTIQLSKDEGSYKAGTDYDVFFNNGQCIVEILPGGAIDRANLTSVTVAYSKVNFTLSELTTELIGGYNVTTGKSTGLELMDMAYFKTGILPDLLIAPGFSQNPAVAAVMAAKTTFSTVLSAHCICDIDTSTVKTYERAAEAKAGSGSFQNNEQITPWPMLGLGDKKFRYSTQLAGAMCALDYDNGGIPSKVASNKVLKADSAILEDGTEVLLDLTQANYLRHQGIVTAYRFVNGFTSWGAFTAAWPNSNDPKDVFINISRMFGFVRNTIVLTFWSQIDENLTPRFAESIVDELNMWLNGLTNAGHLLGARCEIKAEENPIADMMSGIIRVHIYMTPPTPAQEIDYLLEYDVNYVSAVLGGSSGEEE